MATATVLPAVLAALSAMFQTATATTLTGVEVVDGPPTLVPAGTPEALVVGGGWSPDETVIASSTLEPFSDYAQVETITIPVAVMTETGDVAAAAMATRAAEILAAVKALLLADPTLGGLVGYSLDVSGGGKAEPSSLIRLASISARRAISGGTRCVTDVVLTAAAVIPD